VLLIVWFSRIDQVAYEPIWLVELEQVFHYGRDSQVWLDRDDQTSYPTPLSAHKAHDADHGVPVIVWHEVRILDRPDISPKTIGRAQWSSDHISRQTEIAHFDQI
jgi:hypothetical protein